jgi:hypothetical protein
MTRTERITASAWIAGGTAWLAAAVIGAGADDGSGRFYAAEAVWLGAQVLLVAGILGLRGLRPHGHRRLGGAGFGIAIAGRVVFVAAESVAIATGEVAEAILPIGALLTAIGMTIAGVAVVREVRWEGWRRFTPLAMGLFPFAFMFPLVATGAPPETAIALWALPTIVIGVASAGPLGGYPERVSKASCEHVDDRRHDLVLGALDS